MKTQVKDINPRYASEALKKNSLNRPLSMTTVKSYAADMKAGSWILNHQGIAFDEDGVLIDGQHRLHAVIESGCSVPMLVTHGLPKVIQNGVTLHTMDTVDRMRVRSVGSQLRLHGYPNGNHLAAGAVICASICIRGAMPKLSTAQTMKFIETYGDFLSETIGEIALPNDRKATLYGVFAFAKVGNKELGRRFATAYFGMENLKKNHPALTLRRWLERHPATGGSSRWEAVRCIASAIWHMHQDLYPTRLYGSDEAIEWIRSQQKANVRKFTEMLSNYKQEPVDEKVLPGSKA